MLRMDQNCIFSKVPSNTDTVSLLLFKQNCISSKMHCDLVPSTDRHVLYVSFLRYEGTEKYKTFLGNDLEIKDPRMSMVCFYFFIYLL